MDVLQAALIAQAAQRRQFEKRPERAPAEESPRRAEGQGFRRWAAVFRQTRGRPASDR
jgi:hypothetical protein